MITLTWADPGFDVVPVIVPFNDINTNDYELNNPLIEPVVLQLRTLTRTGARFIMRESTGAIQVVRLWVMLHRNNL